MRQRLRLFPRATVAGDANAHSPLPQDPGPSHLLLGEKSSKCAGPPCGTPRRRGVLVSLSPAAGDGGPGVASAPGHPDLASGFRGVDPGHGIDLLLLMLPAALFLPPNRTPEASSIRASGPAQNRVAPASRGHFNAADIGGSFFTRALLSSVPHSSLICL